MAECVVDRCLFGLKIEAPAGHAATALLRALPRDLVLRPQGGAGDWIVGLTADVLTPMRRLYCMDGVQFTEAAIAALQDLARAASSAPQTGARTSKGTQITPGVVPSLRGLDASRDRTGFGTDGGLTQPTRDKHSSDGAPA